MRRFLGDLFGRRGERTRPAAPKARLGLETLDRRDLPSITLSDGVVSVVGDGSNDIVTVSTDFAGTFTPYDDELVVTRGSGSYGNPADNLFLWVYSESDSFPLYGGRGGKLIDTVLCDLKNGWNEFTNSTSVASIVIGGNDPDDFQGGSGADTFYALGGADDLAAGRGDDYLSGGTGSDTYVFTGEGFGSDKVVEGANADSDTLDFTDAGVASGPAGEGVSLWLFGTWGQTVLPAHGFVAASVVTLTDSTGIETAIGSRHHDTIWGNGRVNTIKGLGGNDELHGSDGWNFIYGGTGDDVLYGTTSGRDYLYGESGNDRLYGHGGSTADVLSGGANDDVLVSLGGTASDALTGGTGVDSFWYDDSAAEIPNDYDSFEKYTRRSLHAVGQFQDAYYGATGTSENVSKSWAYGTDPLPDPTDMSAGLTKEDFRDLPLFGAGGPVADDVQQGKSTAACWFMAKLAAIADTDPAVIREAVVDLGDGTYAVRFYKNGTPVYYRVDADLYVESDGTTVHNAGVPTDVLWSAVIEKAMAFHRPAAGGGNGKAGSYEVMSNWVYSNHNEVGAAFGYSDSYTLMTDSGVTKTYFRTTVQNALSDGHPVTLCGPGSQSGWGNGVRKSDHLYTVLGIETTAAGTTLTIRNPYNGTRDGAAVFTVTLDEAYACGHGFYVTAM